MLFTYELSEVLTMGDTWKMNVRGATNEISEVQWPEVLLFEYLTLMQLIRYLECQRFSQWNIFNVRGAVNGIS